VVLRLSARLRETCNFHMMMMMMEREQGGGGNEEKYVSRTEGKEI
jgi:hypothetical protein